MTSPRRRGAWSTLAGALVTGLVLSGCSGPAGDDGALRETGGSPTGPTPSYAVEPPGPLRGDLHSADVLVTSTAPLPDDLVRGIRAVDGVEAVVPLSVASASVDGRTLTVAAVDAARFRRFTGYDAARADALWERLAAGELVVDTGVSRRLVDDGALTLGSGKDAPVVRVGAYAPLVRRIQVLVNESRGEQLEIPAGNALLVSTGRMTPSALRGEFREVVRGRASLETLALELDVPTEQVAVLTGASVSQAVGTFSYTDRAAGEISPDPAWVREYIRTEEVPILGEVTCNKGVLPQLRGALAEVVRRGLEAEVNPDEYAGCYYPRYIGRDPAKGLSLHSWGIAVDLNVPGNLQGTTGEMDREVVAIFKRWGFAWGGDWRYPDPMHFEMNAVVRPAG